MDLFDKIRGQEILFHFTEVAKMAEISQAVNTYCNQTPQVADFMPEVGELCCAKFEGTVKPL